MKRVSGWCVYAVWGVGCVGARAVAQPVAARPAAAKPAAAKPATVQVVMLSDLHFEPYRDPAKVARLRAAAVREWHGILGEPDSPTQAEDFASLSATCHTRGVDTAWTLLMSSLAAARERAPGASFVTVSGDLLSHSFDCRFRALAPGASEEEYTEFAEKTIAYIALELRTAFPRTPVYIALGNNDSGCKDYRETPGSAFLRSVGKSFSEGMRSARDKKVLLHLFPAEGDYSVRLPRSIARGRMVVMQDVFLSREYEACDGKPDAAAAATQLAWLRATLAKARAAHEQVWVMAHIPPGVNVYSTIAKATDVCKGEPPVMFLKDQKLAEVLTEFGDVVRLSVFAHTHMDEMHLLPPGAAGGRPVVAKLVPAISPVNGNEPAFTLADVDTTTARLMDYSVIAGDNQSGLATKWAETYRYSKVYGKADFSVDALQGLVAEFGADGAGTSEHSVAYQHNFFVGGGSAGNRGGLLRMVWPAYVCGMRENTAEGFRACVCKAQP